MPPFQYTPFVDPYVGTIAELMGSSQRAEAEAAQRIGDIRALEAQQRGQVLSGTIGTLGNLGAEYMSPEARRQRELEKAREIYSQGMQGVRTVDDHRFQEGDLRLNPEAFTPQVPPNASLMGPPPATTVTTGESFGPRHSADVLDRLQSGNLRLPNEQLSGLAFTQDRGGLAFTQDRASSQGAAEPEPIIHGESSVETLRRDIVGYTTEDGFFDPRRAMADMSAAGISPDVMNEVMRDVSGNNEILAAFDARETKNEEDQTVLFGRLAATALKQAEGGVLSMNHSIALNLIPLEFRFGEDAINDLRVQLHGLTPDQQKAMLTDAVKAADDILGYTVMTPGQVQVGLLGEPTRPAGISALEEAQDDLMKARGMYGTDSPQYANALDVMADVTRPMGSDEKNRLERSMGIDQGTLALATRRQAEVERANREGEAMDREGLVISAGESLRRYPASLTSLLVTDDQNVINIEESMKALELPMIPKDETLFSRADWTTTGAFSVIARTIGPLTGLSEQSMGNIAAIEIGEAIVVRALAENERLAERERTAISDALDMATTIGQSPITIRAKFREIDDVLRRALYRKDEIDDVKAILQAIDVLGVPQSDEAPAGTVLLWRDGEAYEIPQGDVEKAIAGGFSRSKE
jgi:hypothetical protein